MRPSPAAGQASLEYVAVIALVAAVLVTAGPAVGAPSIPRAVAQTVRLGICIVAGDYCRPGDAEGDELPACALRRARRGTDDSLSIANLRLGKNDEWTVSLGSDGSVSVTSTQGGGAAAVAGLGVEAPSLKLDVGVEGSAGLRVQEAKGWRFPDRAAAQRFVAGLPDSAKQGATWRSGAFSQEVGAAGHVRGLGYDVGSLTAAAKRSDGVRWGPGRAFTIYNELSFSAPELKLLGVQVAGLGTGRLLMEYTTVGGVPTQLAFREAVPSAGGNRLTETVKRLDLRNPGNLFVAGPLLRVPSLPSLRRTLEWIETEGTIERAVYAVNDSSKSIGLTLKAGEELGFSHTAIHVGQTLEQAWAKVPGSKRRDRFDCTDQLR